MDTNTNKLPITPPLKAGDYVKLYDFSGNLIHEGLLEPSPGTFEPYRNDGSGLWTYFFKNLTSGVSICSPHQVKISDGTGYWMRATSYIEPLKAAE